MKTIREYLDNRHPDIFSSLEDSTQEFLEMGEDADINIQAHEYANWHRAHMMTPEALAFYNHTSQDEKNLARDKATSEDLDYNPYQLMCHLNFYILVERYQNALRNNLETLQEILDLDTYDEDTELQQEIMELSNSASKFKDDEHNVAKQLLERADELQEEAEKWLKYIENIQKQ
jgi:hypothetical protein